MSGNDERKRRNERLKMAAIPALAGILGAVLFWPEQAPETATALRKGPLEATAVSHKPKPSSAAAGITDWPPVELSTLLALDPFAAPPAAVPPQSPAPNDAVVTSAGGNGRTATSVEPPFTRSTEVQTLARETDYSAFGTLRAIVEGPSGKLALIDDNQIVREGDVVGAGLQIVKITASEVFVRAVTEPSAGAAVP